MNPWQCRNCLYPLYEDHTQGTLICTECGLVNESHIAYASDLKEDIASLSYSKQEHTNTKLLTLSLRKTTDPKKAKIQKTHSHFAQLCQGFEIPEIIVNEANQLFTELCNRKLYRGSVRVGMIACSLMWAFKIHNVPRTVQEISTITCAAPKIIHKSNKSFQMVMGDLLSDTKSFITDKDIIRRYCSELQLEPKTHNKLVIGVRKLIEQQLSVFDGRKITSIVVVSIAYVSSTLGIPLCKKDISRLFSVSIVTINTLLKQLSNCCPKTYRE
jgi:transcription initiation factor TFIIIB Brf1 subunit/transcription initiation factor TFIIB